MISISAHDLRAMLKQVTPHMSEDDDIPVIHSVRLEARDGWLYAIASDRYTLGASRREIIADGNRTGHVPGWFVPSLAAWLDGTAEYGETVSLSLPVDDRPAPLSFAASGCGTLTVDYDADRYKAFPDWRKILHAALTAEPGLVPLSGVTTRYLTRWQHAADKLTVWQESPRKPFLFLDEHGHFAGMQMPVRYELTRDEAAPGWIAATAHTASVDGQTYDLRLTWEDRHGDPWTYSGRDLGDMPLMVIEGIEDDPHPLDRLVTQYGPLYAAS
uniref:phiSA1p31-related protein n=1 Tax=Streptomyces scabiei TaxID=1930 RepID=UPI000E6947AD|nr:phiSA1p31-related protein [Streptomyces scabiei]